MTFLKFFEDSTVAFNDVKHHGYYVCNKKNFLYRYNAFQEASKSGTEFEWVFNDDIYNALDWSKPINNTLPELYKERAQQLRDKYDYLILAYSGGSDSDNVLHAFIDNKIKLDEVWVDWPLGLMDKIGFTPSLDPSHANIASEWHYSIKPKLDRLRISNPEIKIHISDTASEGKIEDSEDTSVIVGFRTSYQNITRARYISNYQQDLYDKGKNVALVNGIEKPFIFITRDNYLAAGFADLPTVFKNDITASRRTIIEYFYWSPDNPFIVLNQSHAIITYLQNNFQEFRKLFDTMKTAKHAIYRKLNLDGIINKTCYPTWDYAFQTDKFVYTFESNQFNSLLLPFINTEKFATIYYHRYFADAKNMDPKLLFHPLYKDRAKPINKVHRIMRLEEFLKGVVRK